MTRAKLPTLAPRLTEDKRTLIPTGATPRNRGGSWGTLRRRVLDAAGWVCQCEDCRALGRVLPATEVDHILPLADGGTDDPSNLQAINHDCHARKTAREGGKTWRKGRGAGNSGRPGAL